MSVKIIYIILGVSREKRLIATDLDVLELKNGNKVSTDQILRTFVVSSTFGVTP
jgi:hypothetical protein